MEQFNERLQWLARNKNFEQADLARALNKDPATINRWWSGEVTPGPKNLRAICDYFLCNCKWLLFGEGGKFSGDTRRLSSADYVNMSHTVARIAKFKYRIRYLMDARHTHQRGFAELVGVDEARVSGWIKGKVTNPQRTTLQKIADACGCDIDWLATGDGEPFPNLAKGTREILPTPETESGERVSSFQNQKMSREIDDTLTQIKRERFKQQCGTHFEEFFDFVADTYGENKEGIDDFLTELHRTNGNYREWLERKKWIKKNSQDEIDTDIVA